ncbi:hypothetical protein [Lentzea sp. NPDC060358]|uniref:hypothetical protein n=1 Tax=Lentzea sp. NPDC060358 TaxID=3347103 RepID=UPI003651EB28
MRDDLVELAVLWRRPRQSVATTSSDLPPHCDDFDHPSRHTATTSPADAVVADRAAERRHQPIYCLARPVSGV